MYCVLELGLAGVMGLQLCCVQKSAATDGVTDGKLEATAAERSDSTAAAAERSINSYVEDRTVPARSSALSATAIQKLIDEGLTTSTSSGATIGIRGPWTNIPVEPSIPVAAIQVVQVVRCTRAHDPWGPTSEDQIAIFFEN